MKIIYALFGYLDGIIYSIASACFRVIFDIADRQFFTNEQISEIANRIYVVLGVLMLFKLVISAIQYLVNPDSFDDKEKGLFGLLQRTIISIMMIVIVPVVFEFAISIQSSVIRAIPSIILGTETTSSLNTDNIGSDLSFSVLSSFVSPNPGKGGSVGQNGEIHDISSFTQKVTEGIGLLNMGEPKYNYMIIISTLGGAFLCYVLFSMALDIAIRTIKLGIIRILSPIPIAGYITSKDKLNKFIKMAVNVYVDLFIRMAIVYFIILAVQLLINNKGGVSNTGSWIRDGLVNIALIFGLLMFAKNAPKFITELLGLPDVGSGDMADMFKPAWQRAGGAAGALVNPARNAVSNYRKAMENNTDMSSNGRRIRNALRHATGGFVRGSLDSVQGVMAGDDWAKMQQRHRDSVNRSNIHGAAAYMRRTDRQAANERNAETNRRRRELESFFRSQNIDLHNMRNDQTRRGLAESAYNTEMSNLRSDISSLNQQIATGVDSLGNPLSADDILQRKAELSQKIARQTELSTNRGRTQYISDWVNRSIADDLTNSEISAMQTRRSGVQTDIQNAQARYAAATTDDERDAIQREITRLVEERDQIESNLNNQQSLRDTMLEYVTNGTLKTEKPDISTSTIVRGRFDSFFGGEGFTGKGYIDTADLLKNNRSSLYTGEAMTKMRQNADILVDADGSEHKFDVKFNSIPGKQFTYAEIADLKRRVDAGQDVDLSAEGFANAAMLQSAFEDMEKQAAEAYVTANIAAADPSVHSDIKLKGNAAPNSTIVEGIKRLKAQIASSNISKGERDALLKELSDNPGKFFKGASDRQEKMRTKGSRISAYNSGKKDN